MANPLSATQAYGRSIWDTYSPTAAPVASTTTGGVTANPYTTTDLGSLQQQITGLLNIPTVNYSMPSRNELSANIAAYLRPGVDQAIGQRRKQTLTNRAEIDSDAASRGMGRSTWVTDVKDRAMDAEASDISAMESQYAADLLAQVEALMMQHQQNAFAADQLNAANRMSATSSALQAALGLYGNNLDWERQQEQINSSGRRSSGSSNSGTSGAGGTGEVDWYSYFNDLSPTQRYAVISGREGADAKGSYKQQLMTQESANNPGKSVYDDILDIYNFGNSGYGSGVGSKR